MVKNLPATAGATGDVDLIPGLGKSLGGGNGDPFQYSCLGESHGQRSLTDYTQYGQKELDKTELLDTDTHIQILTKILMTSLVCITDIVYTD